MLFVCLFGRNNNIHIEQKKKKQYKKWGTKGGLIANERFLPDNLYVDQENNEINNDSCVGWA